MYSANKQTILH